MSEENVELFRRALDAMVSDRRDGKAFRVRTYLDPAEALEAAGLSP